MPEIVNTLPILALWGVIGYVLGSIPGGIVMARVMGLGDLRQIGSGNIGATNVLRTGSKTAAAATLLFDAGKGISAVLLARYAAGEDAAQLAGLMAFLGHCFPIWLKFKGGKGVATFLGVLLALSFWVGALVCLSWLIAAAILRISSAGALAAAATSTVWALMLGRSDMVVLTLVLTGLVFWTHRANIERLRAGTEPKIGQKT